MGIHTTTILNSGSTKNLALNSSCWTLWAT